MYAVAAPFGAEPTAMAVAPAMSPEVDMSMAAWWASRHAPSAFCARSTIARSDGGGGAAGSRGAVQSVAWSSASRAGVTQFGS